MGNLILAKGLLNLTEERPTETQGALDIFEGGREVKGRLKIILLRNEGYPIAEAGLVSEAMELIFVVLYVTQCLP